MGTPVDEETPEIIELDENITLEENGVCIGENDNFITNGILIENYGDDEEEVSIKNINISDDNSDILLKMKPPPKQITIKPEESYVNKITGLFNKGNTCYLNCFLQTFFCLEDFRNVLRKNATDKNINFILEIEKLRKGMDSSNNCMDTEHFFKVWSDKFTSFKRFTQQDSSEMFVLFLDLLHETCKEIPLENSVKGDEHWEEWKKKRYTCMTDYFFNQTTSSTICRECSSVNRVSNQQSIIYLPVADSILKSIENFCNPNEMTGDNKFKCDTCEDYQDAINYTNITQMGKYLLINLLRYTMEDINKMVDITEYLKNGELDYRLCATIIQQGNMDNGHYVCFVRYGEEWIFCNDHVIRGVENLFETDIIKKSYFLIYERV